ncbi:hypothetical protein ABQ366_05265 [Serratia fonticola]|uniref:hypothetical protein n=1 Tax=Serratia fonticola TaxID=47917 RepID=UPI003AABA6C1
MSNRNERARDNAQPNVVNARLGVGGALLVAVISAVSGTAAAWFSGSKLVESTRIPAQISARTICISAVNQSEEQFRDKSAKFISSVADFKADSELLNQANTNMLRAPAKEVVKNGYSLISYAPPELSKLAMSISDSVRGIAKTPGFGNDENFKRIDTAIAAWPLALSEFAKTFDAKRSECK